MPEPGSSPRRIRVLVVDDDPENRRMLRRLLESWEIEVVGEAADGVEGVELVSSLHPDVVLMDVRMPLMDGIEASRIITSSSRTRVVLVTSHDDPVLRRRGEEAGVFAYLQKEDPTSLILGTIVEAWRASDR